MTNSVERRDPSTGALVTSVPTGMVRRFFAVGEGAVGCRSGVDGTVDRVDPATNRAVATITVDSGAVDGGDLAVGGGFVWARVSDTLVAKIDPATNTVLARYSPEAGSGSVAADADNAPASGAHDHDVVSPPAPEVTDLGSTGRPARGSGAEQGAARHRRVPSAKTWPGAQCSP